MKIFKCFLFIDFIDVAQRRKIWRNNSQAEHNLVRSRCVFSLILYYSSVSCLIVACESHADSFKKGTSYA